METEQKFSIDHAANTFLMNGKPFQYVAGSFHYFRALPQTWRRKLRTMKVAGVNAVDIYTHWALHNPKDGIYNFDGVANVEEMIKIASEEDFYIILRPGPYICSELDNGGLPYWLAGKFPDIKIRTSDRNFTDEVTKWWSVLMPKFENHWFGNGGKIIMVQLENEYGAFKKCDKNYLNFLRDETEKYVKGKALLFTVDGTNGEELECGKIDGVFSTIDFGISNRSEIEYYFEKLRKVQPTGPLVNTEFYTGWYLHWQEPRETRSADKIAETLRILLEMKVNLGFYMFFGGTNFEFWSGANEIGLGNYMADATSYDYDAPMDESGDTTEKFFKIRDVIKDFFPVPALEELPEKIPKISLPMITMRPMGSILSESGREILGTNSTISDHLMTFEEFDQFSGFLLFEAKLPQFTRDPSKLVIEDLRDRAYVFVDDVLMGILSRENLVKSLPISAGSGNRLSILVENQGRIDYQVEEDYKGIRGKVLLQTYHPSEETYEEISNWEITGFPFDNYSQLEDFSLSNKYYHLPADGILSEGPVVLHQQFVLSELGDTYWDTTGWGKGFVFINGFNLGRYWPLVGPQITLYVPMEQLSVGWNTIVIVEYQKVPKDLSVRFTDKARLNN